MSCVLSFGQCACHIQDLGIYDGSEERKSCSLRFTSKQVYEPTLGPDYLTESCLYPMDQDDVEIDVPEKFSYIFFKREKFSESKKEFAGIPNEMQ